MTEPQTSRSAFQVRPFGPTSHNSTRSGLATTKLDDPGAVRPSTRMDWMIGVGGCAYKESVVYGAMDVICLHSEFRTYRCDVQHGARGEVVSD
jgi:hypothetical protein